MASNNNGNIYLPFERWLLIEQNHCHQGYQQASTSSSFPLLASLDKIVSKPASYSHEFPWVRVLCAGNLYLLVFAASLVYLLNYLIFIYKIKNNFAHKIKFFNIVFAIHIK